MIQEARRKSSGFLFFLRVQIICCMRRTARQIEVNKKLSFGNPFELDIDPGGSELEGSYAVPIDGAMEIDRPQPGFLKFGNIGKNEDIIPAQGIDHGFSPGNIQINGRRGNDFADHGLLFRGRGAYGSRCFYVFLPDVPACRG